ncbi:bifunctional helix-turn-helix transcriptional regulator/GNAT family N-acetyltransferase [Aliiruegeria sabulilitoris]|uniref:bifunctional helix-turn-helix transcriptional regulator/GNAT family N-acetyltransferase n=1 Tax=Aliiruegeria sabulilitoris TaxID=1510458 RepID=UPI00082A9CD2|nr:helix-turn-helix domain-containing GNAT family N-acetyltransferase [Aliiruegeria sabulilitoris]NDR59569.1 MarR family transcriptional regulator [Pseudoruegeria sp. M32A2M]
MDEIDRIRAFNRAYTKAIGLLDSSFLESGLSLAEVRLLQDIDSGESGSTAREIASSLRLDEGYASRLFRRFEAKGWIERHPDPKDARRRRLLITPSGLAQLAPFRAAARKAVGERLEELSSVSRSELLAAMDKIDQLFLQEDRTTETPVLREMTPGDAGWIIQRHAEFYAEQYGFNADFEPVVAQILADFLTNRDRRFERGWIAATKGGARLGSVLCTRHDAELAKLRVLFVEPTARGLGLGRALVSACMRHARDTGYKGMTLWTQKSLEAACALYAEQGFHCVNEQAEHAFGQHVVNQTWEIRF